MKKVFTTIAFILLYSATFAQQYGVDSVILINGNIICGKIEKYNPKESLEIQTKSGKAFYSLKDIDRVIIGTSFVRNTNQNPNDSNDISLTENVFELRKGLFTIYAGIGTTILKLQAYEDIKLSSHISVGIGTGYRYVNKEEYLPLLANMKIFSLNDNKHITWFMLSGGYCTNLINGIESGGYIINPSIGYGLKIRGGSFFTIGIDYDIQNGNFINTGYFSFDAYGNMQQQNHYRRGNLSSAGLIIGFTY